MDRHGAAPLSRVEPETASGSCNSARGRRAPSAAERNAVATSDLVGDDAQALWHEPAEKSGRGELVILAEHELRRHVWPRVEGPRETPGSRRLCAFPAQRLLGELAWNVVVIADEGPALPVLPPSSLPCSREASV
jgi:hypothetical protein